MLSEGYDAFGIEISDICCETYLKDLPHECTDIISYSKKNIKYDALICFDVLEHIDGRVEFLKGLHKLSDKILLRVPLVTRDWLAVYKKDNGYKYMLSADHKIEYTEEILQGELKASGWTMEKYSIKFGEIWAAVKLVKILNS